MYKEIKKIRHQNKYVICPFTLVPYTYSPHTIWLGGFDIMQKVRVVPLKQIRQQVEQKNNSNKNMNDNQAALASLYNPIPTDHVGLANSGFLII
jgi:hypothetical protein